MGDEELEPKTLLLVKEDGKMEKIIKTQKIGSTGFQRNILPNSKTKKIKILVVEDNSIVRLYLEAMLSNLGYTADFAEDGKTALKAYSSKYHLILMDIEIPYLNGIEVTQIIRAIEKSHRFKNVPIVAMTSHVDEPEYQNQCRSAGMNDICGKPTANQLKALISEYAA